MRPVVADSELDLLSLSISLAYPIADLILIGVAMGLLTTPGARTRSFLMLGASAPVLVLFVLLQHRRGRLGRPQLVALNLFRERAFSSGLVFNLAFFLGVVPFFFLVSLLAGFGPAPLLAPPFADSPPFFSFVAIL